MLCYWNIFVIFRFQRRSRGGGSVLVCSQDDYLLCHVSETFLWFSVSRGGGSVLVCSQDDYLLCCVIETFLWFSVSRGGPEEVDQSLCVPRMIICYVMLVKHFCNFPFPEEVQRRWISPCVFPGRLSFMLCYWNIFVIFRFQMRSRGGGSVLVCSQDDYLLCHVIETFLWFSVSRRGPEEVDQSLCVPRTIICCVMLLKDFCDFPFPDKVHMSCYWNIFVIFRF